MTVLYTVYYIGQNSKLRPGSFNCPWANTDDLTHVAYIKTYLNMR